MVIGRMFRLGLFFLGCGLFLAVSGQESPARRAEPLRSIQWEGSMDALLSHLAREFSTVIGLETDPRRPSQSIKINLQNVTVDQIIDGVVAAAPNYQIARHDGFIDIYPREGSSPLLDTLIADLEIDSDHWETSSEKLTNSPGVVSTMNQLGLVRRDLPGRGFGDSSQRTAWSLKLQNVTLRRALHEIAKHNERFFWVFQRYGEGGELFSIQGGG